MDVCGGCGATLSPQEQFCGACGRFRGDATTRVWPPQDATAAQAWPPQDSIPPPPLPAPGYYYGPLVPATRTNVLAIISLVAGLVGFVTCFTSAVVAVVTGHIALSQIGRSEQGGQYVPRETGRGLAIAGLILGYIGLALGIGWILLIAAADA